MPLTSFAEGLLVRQILAEAGALPPEPPPQQQHQPQQAEEDDELAAVVAAASEAAATTAVGMDDDAVRSERRGFGFWGVMRHGTGGLTGVYLFVHPPNHTARDAAAITAAPRAPPSLAPVGGTRGFDTVMDRVKRNKERNCGRQPKSKSRQCTCRLNHGLASFALSRFRFVCVRAPKPHIYSPPESFVPSHPWILHGGADITSATF